MFWTQPPKTDLYVFFLHSFIFTQCYYFSSFGSISQSHLRLLRVLSSISLSHLFRKSRPTRVLLLLLPIPFFSSKGDEELRSCSPSFSSSFLFVQSISWCIVFKIKHPVRWRKLLWWCIVKSYYKLGKLLLQKLNSSSR